MASVTSLFRPASSGAPEQWWRGAPPAVRVYAVALGLPALGGLLAIFASTGGEPHRQFPAELFTVLECLVTFIAALGAALQARERSAPLAGGWALISTALFSRLVAGVSQAFTELILHQRGQVSFADFFYLLYYPLMVCGVLLFYRPPASAHERSKFLLDVNIATLIATLFYWVFIISPAIQARHDELEPTLTIAYPSFDVLLLATLSGVSRSLRWPANAPPITLLLAAAAVLAIIDGLYGHVQLNGTEVPGAWLSLGWTAAYLLQGAAAVAQMAIAANPGARFDEGAETSPPRKMTGWTLNLPYLWILPLCVLLGIASVREKLHHDLVTLAVIAVIVTLTLLRQLLITAENKRLDRLLLAELHRRGKAEADLAAALSQLRSYAQNLNQQIEAERLNLARELHDHFGQALTAIKMDVEWACRKIQGGEAGNRNEPVAARLTGALTTVDATIDSVRAVASSLRPAMLEHLGLGAALETMCEGIQTRTGIRCRLEYNEQTPLLPDHALTLYRIVQEAITNVVRHSGAGAVTIRVDSTAEFIRAAIEDDGKGLPQGADAQAAGLGIIGIRERAQLMGATLTLAAGSAGGTVVTFHYPRSNG